MKKILSVLFLMFVINTAFAQDAASTSSSPAYKKFSFGLKVNPAISWLKPDNTALENDGAKLSFGYGIITDFNFAENYSFSTGLEVNNIRGAFRQTVTLPIVGSAETALNTKIQYLTIPLSLKMKTKDIGGIKYFGQFGINNSFRLKAKGDVDTKVGGVVTTINDTDISDDISLIRESLNIALGIEYNLAGSTSAMASVAFDNGFTNIADSKDINGKITSKMIILNLGILF